MQVLHKTDRRIGLDRRVGYRDSEARRSEDDRRREPRYELTKLLDAGVLLDDNLRSAQLVNVSRTGAKFRTFHNPRYPQILPGAQVHFDVVTPYGIASRSGTVMWSSKQSEYAMWGLTFTKKHMPGKDGIDEILTRRRN